MAMLNPALKIDSDQHTRILQAAERAFARHGFRGASMQHVAAEAQMSAGNLYRYFGSKEAIVSGLAERDQAALTQDFRALAGAEDFMSSVEPLLRKHLIDEPIERSRLALEIWAEAARNEVVARLCLRMEAECRARLQAVIDAGVGSEGVSSDLAARAMMTVMTGLFRRRAIDPDFDGEAEINLALTIFQALLAGAVKLGQAERGEPA